MEQQTVQYEESVRIQYTPAVVVGRLPRRAVQYEESIRIQYTEVIDRPDGSVTGIARLTAPANPDLRFEMHVNGSGPAVRAYSEEAAVLKFEFTPLAESARQAHEDLRARVFDFHRQLWYERLDALRVRIGDADAELLQDPGRVWKQAMERDKRWELEDATFDPKRDRRIEIGPTGSFEKGLYRLSFAVDPSVPQGASDIYVPFIGDSETVWGEVRALAGDPDLYLYRGGTVRASSTSSGGSDEVYGSGGSGQWSLRVYGYTNATYQLSGDWVVAV